MTERPTTPLVSVCIPVYNRARRIRECLASVLAQTYAPIEVVVVDDASMDDTAAIVQEFNGFGVRLIRRAKNSLSADVPRYEAVEASRGEYCALLDSDDLWDPRKIEKQVAFLQGRPDIPLCHGYVRIIDAEGRAGGIRHEGVLPPTGLCARSLLQHCFICTSAVMVRREAWLGAQRKSDLKGFGTEWDFFLNIARNHEIGLIPEVVASYRRSPAGVSQGSWRRRTRDVPAMERIYRKRLWEGVVREDEMRFFLAEACAEDADHHYYLGHGGHSAWFAARGLRWMPGSAALYYRLLRAPSASVRRRVEHVS